MMTSATRLPVTSSRLQPKITSACRFQSVTRPASSSPMKASPAVSMIPRVLSSLACRASSARRRSTTRPFPVGHGAAVVPPDKGTTGVLDDPARPPLAGGQALLGAPSLAPPAELAPKMLSQFEQRFARLEPDRREDLQHGDAFVSRQH